MGLFSFLKSTILSKVVMAVTGAIFVLYIIVHTLGNLQVFGGPDMINGYASFLHSTGELLWVFRLVLIVALILHVITAVRLYVLNKAARHVDYKVRKWDTSNIASRTMIWGGIALFLFVTYHVLHLTLGVVDPANYGEMETYARGTAEFQRVNVYYMMVMGFRQPLVTIIYVLGLIALGFHLFHGFQSMFQSLGFNGPRFTPVIMRVSMWFAVIITLLLISIPISVLLGLVGGNL